MNIYLIGDYAEEIDDSVKLLEGKNINIIAKAAIDINQVEKEVADSLNKGYIIVIPKEPMKAIMSLNKNKDIYAAPCSTERDVELALSNDANALILNDLSRKEEVLNYLINKLNQQKSEDIEVESNEGKEEGAEAKESVAKAENKKKRRVEKTKEEGIEGNKNEENGEGLTERDAEKKKKGIFGSLKDALGITNSKGD